MSGKAELFLKKDLYIFVADDMNPLQRDMQIR